MAPTPIDRTDEAAISLLTHLLRDTRLFQKSANYLRYLHLNLQRDPTPSLSFFPFRYFGLGGACRRAGSVR